MFVVSNFCLKIKTNVRNAENVQEFQKLFLFSRLQILVRNLKYFCIFRKCSRISKNIRDFKFFSEFHEMIHFFVITNLVRNLKNDRIPENVQGLQKMFVISIFFRNFMKCSILIFFVYKFKKCPCF